MRAAYKKKALVHHPDRNGEQLRKYRTKMGQKKSPEAVREAVQWLSYTYLYVRMMKNPLAYGIPWDQKESDPHLYTWRTELVHVMAQRLDRCRMAPGLLEVPVARLGVAAGVE